MGTFTRFITLKIFLPAVVGLVFTGMAWGQEIRWDPEEIEGPICVASDTVLGQALPLAPEVSTYNVIITDGIAHVQLSQLFVNPFPGVNDLVYVFPLPHQGSVHAMAMEFNDSIYKAEIFEKQRARDIYDSVLQDGGNAALLIQDKPNIFQQRLANIPQGDSAYVRIEFSLPLKYESGEWELAIPTMIGERFGSGVTNGTITSSVDLWNPPEDREGSSLYINVLVQTGYPLRDLRSPLHSLEILDISAGRPRMETINLLDPEDVLERPHNRCLFLQRTRTYPNRDFILRFSRDGAQSDYTVASHFDTDENRGHFALQLFPDLEPSTDSRPDLELVLLMDISGSQSGWPLEKEKEIVLDILNRLQPTDRLTLASFSTVMNWAFGENAIVDASATNLETARTFAGGQTAGGGTQLLSAVNNILAVPQESEHQRIFVFLTDGFITNEEAIFEAIRNHPSQPTIFTFGAGNNLNRYFLDVSAEIGGGASFEVTSADAVAPVVDLAWEKIESPQMKNISLTFSGAVVGDLIFPRGNHLFAGSPLSVFGRYTQGGPVEVVLSGYLGGEKIETSKSLNLAQASNTNYAIPKIWAKQKISQLELEEGTTDTNKAAIIDVSVDYQVLSKYTAFLAVNPQHVSDGGSIKDDFVLTDVNPFGPDFSWTAAWIRGILMLNFSTPVDVEEWVVYDLFGRVVLRGRWQGAPASKTTWEIEPHQGGALSPGKYILRLKTSSGSLQRVIVMP